MTTMQAASDLPKRGWRFSLRGLLALVTAVGVVLGVNVTAVRFCTDSATAASAAELVTALLIAFNTIVYAAVMLSFVCFANWVCDESRREAKTSEKLDAFRVVVILAMCVASLMAILLIARLPAWTGVATIDPQSKSHTLSPLVICATILCLLVWLIVPVVAFRLIETRWWTQCAACGKRRAGRVKGEEGWFDLRCSHCGYTKKNVARINND